MSAPLLLQIARDSIVEVLEARNILNPQAILKDYPVLKEPLACFVTLYINDELRGASGEIFSESSLLESIIYHAKIAAFQDPRFSPLKTSEFLQMVVELSLLTPPVAVQYNTLLELKEKLRPGIDGVYLRLGEHQSAFLPQLRSQLETFELFFHHLCEQAGLNLDDCQSNPEIFTFEIEKERDEPILSE